MKVSVVIPIYNVEKYLNKCLDSVISQSYKNLEIILVNDGSKDGSKQICEKYKRIDKRIVLINQENGGLSDARNKGIQIATGEYITFIDSDDYIHKDMIKELIYNAINTDADISICGYKTVFEDLKTDDLLTDVDIQIINSEELINNFYNKFSLNIIVAWAKIYKRSLFEDIRYPKGKIHEDEFIAHRLVYISKKIVYTPKKMYYYRINPNSITGKKFNKKRLDKIEALENRLNFSKEKKLESLYINTLCFYCHDLILCYYLIKKNENEAKNLQTELGNKFLKNYKKVLKSDKIGVKQKIRIIIERIIPSVSARLIIKYKKMNRG